MPLPNARRPVALVVDVDAFLDRFRDDPATRATCTETLRRLRETAGDQVPVAALTPEIYEQTMARWDERAANTWNKHLSAPTSFTAYCGRQDWLTTDPGRRLERRKVTRTRDKAIPRAQLDRLFTDDRRAVAQHERSHKCGLARPCLGAPPHIRVGHVSSGAERSERRQFLLPDDLLRRGDPAYLLFIARPDRLCRQQWCQHKPVLWSSRALRSRGFAVDDPVQPLRQQCFFSGAELGHFLQVRAQGNGGTDQIAGGHRRSRHGERGDARFADRV